MSKKDCISIGNCGEYFVAAELERRGYSVAVPLSNTPNFDVLAINRETQAQFAIQVKTTSYGDLKWMVSEKSETLEGSNIFYVFVHLNELGTPDYYIIPSSVVANYIREINRLKSSKTRTFVIKGEFMKYKNAWDTIK